MGVTINGQKPEPLPEPVKPEPVVVEPAVKKGKAQKEVKSAFPTGSTAAITAAIHKSKGEHVVVAGNSIPPVPRLRTGIFEFDLYTGGGFPRGRYSIVYGPESSCKTNLAYAAAAQAQRDSPNCNKVVWVNLEGTFDPQWAGQFGLDTSQVIVVNPGYGEEAVDLIDAYMRAEDVSLLVVDSIAALVGSKEIGQSAESFDVGTSSLLIKRLVMKMMYAFAKEKATHHEPCVILINQTRYKIGVMFGDPETMPGGEAQKFLASLRIRTYGKNIDVKDVNPNKHAIKQVSVVVKKSKVPVLSNKFDLDMVMIPHDNLSVGQTNSWPTVKNYLQQLGLMTKSPKGYEVLGNLFPKQSDIEDQYLFDEDFRLQLQGVVIDSLKEDMKLVDEAPEPAAHFESSKAPGTEVPVDWLKGGK